MLNGCMPSRPQWWCSVILWGWSCRCSFSLAARSRSPDLSSLNPGGFLQHLSSLNRSKASEKPCQPYSGYRIGSAHWPLLYIVLYCLGSCQTQGQKPTWIFAVEKKRTGENPKRSSSPGQKWIENCSKDSMSRYVVENAINQNAKKKCSSPYSHGL